MTFLILNLFQDCHYHYLLLGLLIIIIIYYNQNTMKLVPLAFVTILIVILVSILVVGNTRPVPNNIKRDMRPYIVCLRAHKSDALTCFNAYKLIAEVGRDRVLLLFDNSRTEFHGSELQRIFPEENVVLVTDEECKRMHVYHKSQWETVEAAFVSVYLHALKNLPVQWDDIWIIESDVYCDGKYLDLLDACAHDCKEDLIGINGVVPNDNTENWVWWNHLEGRIASVPVQDRAGLFIAVLRGSRHFFETLEQSMNIDSGFAEVFLPTLAKYSGLSQGWIPNKYMGDMDWQRVAGIYDLPRKGDGKIYHKVSC